MCCAQRGGPWVPPNGRPPYCPLRHRRPRILPRARRYRGLLWQPPSPEHGDRRALREKGGAWGCTQETGERGTVQPIDVTVERGPSNGPYAPGEMCDLVLQAAAVALRRVA